MSGIGLTRVVNPCLVVQQPFSHMLLGGIAAGGDHRPDALHTCAEASPTAVQHQCHCLQATGRRAELNCDLDTPAGPQFTPLLYLNVLP